MFENWPCPDGWGFYIARVRVECEEWGVESVFQRVECEGWRACLPPACRTDRAGRWSAVWELKYSVYKILKC